MASQHCQTLLLFLSMGVDACMHACMHSDDGAIIQQRSLSVTATINQSINNFFRKLVLPIEMVLPEFGVTIGTKVVIKTLQTLPKSPLNHF